MRKVRILPLLVFACMAVGLTACGFFEIFNTGGGDPNDVSCDYVLKKHAKSIAWHLSLTCKYQEKCEANVAYIGVLELGLDNIQCYHHSEYTFNDGKTKKTVKMNTTVPVTVDDDDHVRFSLFDSEKVEKTYDIDLSEIIHSYTVKDDSVEIKMPYKEVVLIRCPICKEKGECCYSLTKDYCQYDNYTDSMKTIMVGKQWDYSYYVKYSLSGQSSFGADSIAVTGNIYFR